MASFPAMAQQFDVIDVPAAGYEGTDTLHANNSHTIFYNISVGIGLELVFDFRAVGNGSFSVFLSKIEDPLNYYRGFSTPQPVTEFSRVFPADFGFAQVYFIQVNTSSEGDIQYHANIHTEKASTGNYNLYYVLIIVGFVILVILSYKFVVWQEKREKEDKKKQRKRKNRK